MSRIFHITRELPCPRKFTIGKLFVTLGNFFVFHGNFQLENCFVSLKICNRETVWYQRGILQTRTAFITRKAIVYNSRTCNRETIFPYRELFCALGKLTLGTCRRETTCITRVACNRELPCSIPELAIRKQYYISLDHIQRGITLYSWEICTGNRSRETVHIARELHSGSRNTFLDFAVGH